MDCAQLNKVVALHKKIQRVKETCLKSILMLRASDIPLAYMRLRTSSSPTQHMIEQDLDEKFKANFSLGSLSSQSRLRFLIFSWALPRH